MALEVSGWLFLDSREHDLAFLFFFLEKKKIVHIKDLQPPSCDWLSKPAADKILLKTTYGESNGLTKMVNGTARKTDYG